MAVAMSELNSEARRLYQEALQQVGHAGPQSFTGKQGNRGGGSLERSVYDPRDYKIADLHAELSLATFKKWRHDLDLLLETIGTSWKGVTALLRTAWIFTEDITSESLRRSRSSGRRPSLVLQT